MTLAPESPPSPVKHAQPPLDEPGHAPPQRFARRRHVPVGGVPIFDGDERDALALLRDALRRGLGGQIATANLDFLALARKDPALYADLAACDLVVADGAPVAWLARLAGAANVSRVAGVDLVYGLLGLGSPEQPLRIALYGSSDAISQRAAERIGREFPHVTIVCRICPPFRTLQPGEIEAERSTLRNTTPDVVLVALGCPRQERLIASYFDSVPNALWIGVGGTLDFLAGHRRRAPAMAQRVGLEWTIRLAQEPRRLWRRYLVRDLPALLRLAPGCLAGRARQWSLPTFRTLENGRGTPPQPTINAPETDCHQSRAGMD